VRPARRTARGAWSHALLAACCALAQANCGDDDGPGSVSVPGDRDAAMNPDGGPGAGTGGSGGGPGRPPARDAGRDGSTVPDGSGPDPDDDGGTPSCRTLGCERLTDECNIGYCDEESTTCRVEPRDDGTACGDRTLDHCTAPDTCRAGVCVPNHRSSGTPCGPQNVDCHVNDTCDGNGVCVDRGLRPEGTPCGSQLDDDCTAPDTCDAVGECRPNHAPPDTVCGDLGQAPGTACHFDDRCDGDGQCVDQGMWSPATSCPFGAERGGCLCGRTGPYTTCHPGPDLCVAGECRPGHELFAPDVLQTTDGLACGDAQPSHPQCDDPDTCLAGICRQNPRPLGTACGNPSDSVCDRADSCDGFGNCDANVAAAGTICNPAPDECWYDQRCDAAGVCLPPQRVPEGTACDD
jgi:hypothetical protein